MLTTLLPTIIAGTLIVLLLVALVLLAIILIRTARFARTVDGVEPAELVEMDAQRIAEHLGEAIRLQTVSSRDPARVDRVAFLEMHRLLEQLYPRVHATLKKEIINDYSLLYTWEGSDEALEPLLLAAHMDVVPVDRLADWTYPPFSGEIAEGHVWGRGSMDDKFQVIGILEAVEYLLKTNFSPQRTVYLAFGHDEEVGGQQGAAQIAALLQERGVRLESVLDEGGGVVEGMLPGIQVPTALMGVGEKGYLSLLLSVETAGGHSSTPPAQTAIGILAAAVTRIESRPFPAHLGGAQTLFRCLAMDAPFNLQMAFANLWLFGSSVRRRLDANPSTAATIRTTQAVTMIEGGIKDNILPSQVRAVLNCRILPGEDLRYVYEHVMATVGDPRVTISPLYGETLEGTTGWNPSPISDPQAPAYLRLEGIVREHFPGAAVAPYVVLGGTDARYYHALSDNVYRFSPVLTQKADMERIHGLNERLSLENCARVAAFFVDFIQESAYNDKA